MAQNILYLAVGGALGTLARYGLGALSMRWLGPAFPWGTLAVNLLGCFLFGVIFAAGTERWVMPMHFRLLLLTGFLGAFTTFSTYAFETTQMLRDAQWLMASINLVVHTVLGLVLMLAGMALGRMI